MNRAVFLDRDGTINAEVNYLRNVAGFSMLPGVPAAIKRLKDKGWMTVVITNQSGIARGYYTVDDVAAIHARMQAELSEAQAQVDTIYVCPHQPEDNCLCRKPLPGLFQQAAREMTINLNESVLVGDKLTDLLPARQLGCRSVLVLTGHGADQVRMIHSGDFMPDHVASDLQQAVEWILACA
ncbi:MAG: D-glycero-beta-D-manno-heptose 1,7-bisphosphate 7-phosphatase [Chloroflexi bacterium]|nr:D-glycero-beta-D-manno-heptose 1,7-bisphosphate 7-phosphatase [Chloroflexota bacterium]MCL5274158.1 D-glycero-beta-D-manno-heptose 1,7-bisphosphate 7-phosphatase [Chloroflexota bacterium]